MADGTGLDKDQSPLLYDLRRVGDRVSLMLSLDRDNQVLRRVRQRGFCLREGWAWAVQPNMNAASGTINSPSVSLCLSTTIQSPLFFVTIDREFLTGHEIQRPIRQCSVPSRRVAGVSRGSRLERLAETAQDPSPAHPRRESNLFPSTTSRRTPG